MTKIELLTILKGFRACSEGLDWVEHHSSNNAFDIIPDIPRLDWLVWLLGKLNLESSYDSISYQNLLDDLVEADPAIEIENDLSEISEIGEITWATALIEALSTKYLNEGLISIPVMEIVAALRTR